MSTALSSKRRIDVVFRLILPSVLMFAAMAPPAAAETIFLKNGTRVSGKIVKEDAQTFSLDTPTGRRKVPKSDVEQLPPPDPVITVLSGIILAGGGHIYEGVYDRAGFFFGLSAGLAAGSYWLLREIRPSSPSWWAVAAVIGYFTGAAVGATDAYGIAMDLSNHPRYRVVYDGP